MGRETAGPRQTGRTLDELGGKRKIIAVFLLISLITISYLHFLDILIFLFLRRSGQGPGRPRMTNSENS